MRLLRGRPLAAILVAKLLCYKDFRYTMAQALNSSHLNGNTIKHPSFYTEKSRRKLSILMLEPNEYYVAMVKRYFKEMPFTVNITSVSARNEYTKALEEKTFDVILSAYNIPQFSAHEALKIRNQKNFRIPFILFCTSIPEENAVKLLQSGANDYVFKERSHRLLAAITEAIKKQKAIADKLSAEKELKEINLKYQAVFDNPMNAFVLSNKYGDILEVNKSACNMFGYTVEEMKKLNRKDILVVNDPVFIKSLDIRHKEGKAGGEIYGIKKNGKKFPLAFISSEFINGNNEMRVSSILTDISERKKLEKEYQKEKFLRQKQNTEIAIEAQEQERKHIGKELHDNVNQILANAKMMIDMARNSPNVRETCINRSYDALSLAIEEVRKLSHSMVPPLFKSHHTFVDAVNALVEDINLSGNLKITLGTFFNKRIRISDTKIKLTFYRIIQEQINNILKYSKASEATIDLKVIKNSYQLVITDNGIGFNIKAKTNGIGLRNIAGRVELHQGTMKIISAPGKGCTIKITIPF